MELVYPAVTGLARLCFRALGLRLSVEGDEHVPASGAFVLASNHVSYLDFALVGLAASRSRRRMRFLARHELWRPPVVGALMRRMRHVPVDRTAPAAAYVGARGLLRTGEAVGIFPEAGVSTAYTVRALMPGTVALAHATGVPVLPMAIWGAQRILTADRPIDLTRGRPVSLLGLRLQSLLDELQSRPEHRPPAGRPAPWHPAHLGGTAPTRAEARLRESVPSAAA